MKITVYTTTDCQFSKQEKEYLTAHNLPYEERNLETNREYLTEMLTISNNFAGTPVTKIEKDDGQVVILKGFTKEEFDETLGFKEATAAPAQEPTPAPSMDMPHMEEPVVPPAPVEPPAAPAVPPMPTPPPAEPVSITPPMPEPPAAEPAIPSIPEPVVPPAQEPVEPSMPSMPAAPAAPQAPVAPPQDDQLNSILNSLQSKLNAAGPSITSPMNDQQSTANANQPASNSPQIPDFNKNE